MKKSIITALTLAATCAASLSATYTWSGGALDGSWSDTANWLGGTAPSGGGHTLVFSGNNQTTSNNNNRLTTVAGIQFDAAASPFVLTGSAVTLGGNISNRSGQIQTINIGLTVNGVRTIDTGAGSIILSGTLGSDAAHRNLLKEGKGTLELKANNSYNAVLRIIRGTLALDASTGSIASVANLYMGNPTTVAEGNNTTFLLKGANHNLGKTINFTNAAANVVKTDGFHLTLPQVGTVASQATISYDLTTVNSAVSYTTAPNLTSHGGRLLQSTVTKMVGGLKTTSFAGIDTGDGNKVVALSGLADLATNPATGNSSNVFLEGSYNNGVADRSMNSLTLKGAGGGTVGDQAIQLREILMEERSGNYTFTTRVNSASSTTPLFVHQYSTSGTLTFNNAVLADNATSGFVKAGPGTVNIASSSTSLFSGTTSIQSGVLNLDGAFTKTVSATVYDGATLSGGGTLGSGGNPTAALIREGGTLAGSTTSALSINGTLAFAKESNFSMTLSSSGSDFVSATGAVTLGADVNLTLALSSAPLFGQEILLLSGSSVTDEFATINGQLFGPEGTFTLTYAATTYDFQIFYGPSSVWVQAAIPEPSAVLLLGMGGLAVLLRRRVRNSKLQ